MNSRVGREDERLKKCRREAALKGNPGGVRGVLWGGRWSFFISLAAFFGRDCNAPGAGEGRWHWRKRGVMGIAVWLDGDFLGLWRVYLPPWTREKILDDSTMGPSAQNAFRLPCTSGQVRILGVVMRYAHRWRQ